MCVVCVKLPVHKRNGFGKRLVITQPELFGKDKRVRMELRVYKALCGATGGLKGQFKRIKGAGYEGVEVPVPKKEEANFKKLVKGCGWPYITRVLTAGPVLCLAFMIGAGCHAKRQESTAPTSSSPAFVAFADE
jgi:hypothetical protein